MMSLLAFSPLYCIKQNHRFHVAVRLFSDRSHVTLKRGKNISDALAYKRFVWHLPYFDVVWDVSLNRSRATWNQLILLSG